MWFWTVNFKLILLTGVRVLTTPPEVSVIPEVGDSEALDGKIYPPGFAKTTAQDKLSVTYADLEDDTIAEVCKYLSW